MKATIIILLVCLLVENSWCSQPPQVINTCINNACIVDGEVSITVSWNNDEIQKQAFIKRLRAKLSPTLPNLDQLSQRTNSPSCTTPNSSTQQH